MAPEKEYFPKWENRRRVIFLTLIFCAAIVVYLTIWGDDTTLNETIAQFSFILGGAVIGTYVFGAAWEDIARLRK